MKKTNLLALVIILTTLTLPALSHAGFLNDIVGSYKISGKKCRFGEPTRLTGKAQIVSSEDGATLNIDVIIGNYATSIPFSFENGSGDIKTTTLEGYIVKLPVARRTVWSTDEDLRKSSMTQYEGLMFPKKLTTSTLAEMNAKDLVLKIEERDSIKIECELSKE